MNTGERDNISDEEASSPLPRSTNNEGRGDINPCEALSPMLFPTAIGSRSNAEAHTASSGYPVIDQHQFWAPQVHTNFQATHQYSTAQPTQTFLSPPMQYPPYPSYQHSPYHNIANMSPSFPLNPFPFNTSHPSSSGLRPLAPKPPEKASGATSAAEGTNFRQPLDFIETVKTVRKQLYEMGRLQLDSDEPHLAAQKVHTDWRKLVTQAWKPVSFFFLCSFCEIH